MATLALRGLSKSFGATQILKQVDLSVADGEFLSLVGPSGCGKSTLLRIVAGLESADKGSVEIGGAPAGHLRAADRDLAMVFQSYALYPHLTVADNIAVPLRMRRLTAAQRLPLLGPVLPGARSRGREIEARVRAVADMLDIAHLLDRRPGQLSGGQRQRVALGRAMVREPAAFLLDEPLSNLDAKMRLQTRTEIAALNRRLGTTFLHVTHDQVEAMTMSDRIAVMMDGEILQLGTPEELYDRPADIRVARFIGSPAINILPAETDASGHVLLCGHDTGMRAAAGGRIAHLGLRPEALAPASHGPVAGRVRTVENLGSDIYVQIGVLGVESPVTVRCAPTVSPRPRIGETLFATPVGRMIAFDAAGKAVPLVRAEVAVHV